MALSVTGSGLTIPNIDVSRAARMDWNTVAEGMGKFAQGVRKDLANQEYADLLGKRQRMNDIQAEIQQLESRNAELQSKMDSLRAEIASNLSPVHPAVGLAAGGFNQGLHDAMTREIDTEPNFGFNWR